MQQRMAILGGPMVALTRRARATSAAAPFSGYLLAHVPFCPI